MTQSNHPLEIHIHGQVSLRSDVTFAMLQEALKPLWQYAHARSLADGSNSFYDDEPGIKFDAGECLLQMCWTVEGNEDFRLVLDEICMNLNEVSQCGAALEVTFYDSAFDNADEDETPEQESRDDFIVLFVGPDPAAIMQVQRDLLVQDVVSLMERHFESGELTDVVKAIDNLFHKRFDDLVSSLQLGRPPRGTGGTGGTGGQGGTGHGGRKPRHLH